MTEPERRHEATTHATLSTLKEQPVSQGSGHIPHRPPGSPGKPGHTWVTSGALRHTWDTGAFLEHQDIPGPTRHTRTHLGHQDMPLAPGSHLGYQGISLVPGHTLDTWEPGTQLRHLAIYNTVGIPGHPGHKWTTKPSGTQLDTWVSTTRLSFLDSQKTLRTQLRQQ
ncbi:hypothetical protein Pmani_021921 [Petrolisthes manimaculis]|nr:hypothetical protein Pmani_021921 [Petrolisthes manimaculis]